MNTSVYNGAKPAVYSLYPLCLNHAISIKKLFFCKKWPKKEREERISMQMYKKCKKVKKEMVQVVSSQLDGADYYTTSLPFLAKK